MADSEGEISYDKLADRIDRNKAKRVIYMITIVAALGGFLFGYDNGVIGSVLLYVPFPLTANSTAILVSYISFIAAIGAVVAGPITDRFGRKSMLIADGAMYFVFAILAAVSTNLTLLIIWRSLAGFAIGADTAVATSYISEYVPSRSRGKYAYSQQLMIFSGGVISFWVGYALAPSADWRLMLGLAALPAAVMLILRSFLPESPRWLVMNGKVDKAKQILKRIGVEVKEKIIPPGKDASYFEILKNRSVRNALIVVGLWLAFQQITGINVILYYGPYIYKYIGLSGSRAILNTAISETLGVLEFWVSFMLIEKWGRRGLGILGYGGIAGSLIIMLVGIMYFSSGALVIAAIVIFAASTLFLVFFHVGVGGVGWILQGESLDPHYRVTGAGIMAAADWIANGIILWIFPIWKADYGLFSFFAFELVLSAISVIFVVLMVPETKGKTIEQMDQVYGRPIRELRKEVKLK
ncbi:D-xylose transporter XylE [Thermoplasmatales archaeon]|nr:D-xylose transporter XylE [Thermoplasmatales archaeon]